MSQMQDMINPAVSRTAFHHASKWGRHAAHACLPAACLLPLSSLLGCSACHTTPAAHRPPPPSRLPTPQDPRHLTLHDLKRSRALAGTLFNVLFNLSKFMAYETRDPFVSRQVRRRGGVDSTVRALQCAWPACTCLHRTQRALARRHPEPQEREDGLTEWDRFARQEYLRLAMEEDADNDTASDGAWGRLDAL